MADRLAGVIAPLLTPYNDDLAIAQDLYLAHAAEVLAGGAHYLSPFGTTGEGPSHSMRERMETLEALVESGAAPADRLMPGIGGCALPEVAELARHAAGLGCAAVMVLPPFFFANADDEGLYRYFATLIDRLGTPVPRICLYHIPQMTGVGISPELAARLNAAFPQIVVAYKDSSGDWDNTRAVIEAAPGISVFPGSESYLMQAMELGGGGCISATCNSNVTAIRALYDLVADGALEAAKGALPAVNMHRRAVQEAGLTHGLKALKAHQTGDSRWLTLRPPLRDADPAVGPNLAGTLG